MNPETDRENILVPLLLAYPAEFEAIPDALLPAVRRLILAAARAERGRWQEAIERIRASAQPWEDTYLLDGVASLAALAAVRAGE